MLNVSIAKQDLPRDISWDNDPLLLYHRLQANLPQDLLPRTFLKRLLTRIRKSFG
jgi:hypothetical protein|tara:strand:- start:205 stop:369 length:165 start_codon:yes stop_codon:yes gene_type:complete